MNKYRSHLCSDLSINNLGEKVTLSGWADTIRDHGNLLFIVKSEHRCDLYLFIFDPSILFLLLMVLLIVFFFQEIKYLIYLQYC